MMTTPFQLERNTFGHLILTDVDGASFDNVVPIRAFPVLAPNEGISLVTTDGRETAWIDQLDDLSAPIRALVEEELSAREFMPHISRIAKVSSFAVPCTWHIETDRGDTQFVLRGEEDIRRIGRNTLLISDVHGIHYLIKDMAGLDKGSRKILDRFL
jgi:hypothetical protein